MNILVGYASAHGSTAEIAKFIANVLQEQGLKATAAEVAHLETLEGYDAFVLGSAVHGGMWLTAMSQFLSRFQAPLAQKPLFFFITCIRVLEEGGYKHAVEEYVNHQVLESIGARELTAFAGRLELNAVDWEERWTLAARYDGLQPLGSRNNDYRDWDVIRTWTNKVAAQLKQA